MTSALPDPHYDAAFYDGVPVKRLFAWAIDVAIVLAITFVLGLVTFTILWWFFLVTYAVVAFFYRWITISRRSATIGMRVMAIELRGPTGAPLRTEQAAIHTLAYQVAWGFLILQVISIALMLNTTRGQGLHDLLTGAVMLNRARE